MRSAVELRVVDLILTNADTMHVHKWVYTDSKGLVNFHPFTPFPFAHIAKSLLADYSPEKSELPEHRRIVALCTTTRKLSELDSMM